MENETVTKKLLILEIGEERKGKNGDAYCKILAKDTSSNELKIVCWDNSMLNNVTAGAVVNAGLEFRITSKGNESIKLISLQIVRTAEEQAEYASKRKPNSQTEDKPRKSEPDSKHDNSEIKEPSAPPVEEKAIIDLGDEFAAEEVLLDDAQTEQKTDGDKSLFKANRERLIFPLIQAQDILVRAQQCTSDYVQVLLYKDARYDMRVLDDMFGMDGWERDSEILPDGTCHLRLRCKINGNWITRDEYGAPSTIDPVKGASSDALKRAVTSFGGGRELYSCPKSLYIKTVDRQGNSNCRVGQNKKGAYELKDTIVVSYIKYSPDRKIEELKLYNLNLKKECFSWKRAHFTSETHQE